MIGIFFKKESTTQTCDLNVVTLPERWCDERQCKDRHTDPIRGEFSSSQLVQGDLVKHSLSVNASKIICKVMLSGAASSGLSADSVWHQIYSICFTGRGVLVQQLAVSHHSETHTGLIAGFFWMELLYPIVLTLVSFSCQRCIKLELSRRHVKFCWVKYTWINIFIPTIKIHQ